MVFESTGKRHDVVVSNGAANQNRHGSRCLFRKLEKVKALSYRQEGRFRQGVALTAFSQLEYFATQILNAPATKKRES